MFCSSKAAVSVAKKSSCENPAVASSSMRAQALRNSQTAELDGSRKTTLHVFTVDRSSDLRTDAGDSYDKARARKRIVAASPPRKRKASKPMADNADDVAVDECRLEMSSIFAADADQL